MTVHITLTESTDARNARLSAASRNIGTAYDTRCNRNACTGVMVDDGGGTVVCPRCFATHGVPA